MQKIFYLLLAFGIFSQGCAHSIHQYFVGDSATLENKGKSNISNARSIHAEAEQFVILGFAFSTNYAEKAYIKLIKQCPKGELVGIQSRLSTSLGFLSYTNKLVLNGKCVE